MNKNVILLAIKDLKDILNQIEMKTQISEIDYIKLEKEINSFLSNLSSYKLRYNVKNNKLFSAFQYAFNLIKHEKRVSEIKKIKTGGLTFPTAFSLNIPCNKVYWIDIKKIKPTASWERQYKNYIMKLNGKQIIDTLNELEPML